METATKAPKKKNKKSCIHSQPLSCSTNGKVMEKKLTDSCSKLCRDAFQCPCCFHFFTCTKKKKKKNMFSLHISLFHITSLSLVRLKQHLCCYLLLCTLHFVCECAVVFCPHRAAQLSPQSSTLVPGCSSEQVWWWRPRPAWGPAPRRRCWETARTHGSGTLWSSASNGSWEEW